MSYNKLFNLLIISFILFSCKNQTTPHEKNIKPENEFKGDSGLSEENTSKIPDSKHQQKVVNQESLKTPADEQSKITKKTESSTIPGPKGYVGKNHVILYEEQSTGSKKITTLQKGSTIYLLETSMTNEKGELASYPTWYKIQGSDKKMGWVKGSDINFGH